MTRTRSSGEALRTILIPMTVPEDALAALRTEFREIRFIVPGEGIDAQGRYQVAPAEPTADEIAAADAVIAWRATPEMLAAPRLRWIHSGGAGVDGFDLAAIGARGITLTNSSGIAAPNIAEHVLGMMIALARRLPTLVRAQARHEWRDHQTHAEVSELGGSSLLIVGVGDIGRAVASRATAFDMRLSGVRRRPDADPPPGFERIFGADALHKAIASADHVVITLPGTRQTARLFDAAAFAAMKPGAIVYNVGRGSVIDTAALVDALQSGHLGGAGLDVTDPEPLPQDSPLWEMENVLITSHTSGATPRYWDRLRPLIAANIRRIQRGERPRNVVDLDAGY